MFNSHPHRRSFIGLSATILGRIPRRRKIEETLLQWLIGSVGVALNIALIAAGVFLVILRPFKAGDFVQAGGITGAIHEFGPFAAAIISPGNVSSFGGNNNRIFSDTIQNCSANPFRRLDRTA